MLGAGTDGRELHSHAVVKIERDRDTKYLVMLVVVLMIVMMMMVKMIVNMMIII